MAPETITISSGSLPLDGSSLTTTFPPAGATSVIKLSGVLRFDYAGLDLDGAHADEPGSLLQIEPGQWHLVDANPALHQYSFQPSSPLTSSASVHLDVDALVDKYLISPSEVHSSLSGTMTVELTAVLPDTPPLLGLGVPKLAGLGLIVVILAAVVARKHRARRVLNQDLKNLLARIRDSAAALEKMGKGRKELGPRAAEQIPFLVRSAEHLVETAVALRGRLRAADLEGVEARSARLQHASSDDPAAVQETTEVERQLALLRPLAAEEKRITEKLERIRDSMQTLKVAWVALDTPNPAEGSQKAAELLDSVENEIKAAVATQQELNRL